MAAPKTFSEKCWISFKRQVLFRLDLVLALALMGAWFVVLLPVAALRLAGQWVLVSLRVLSAGALAWEGREVVLFSFEGHKVAPTRVRCYHFCDHLKKIGVNASVYAYWDRFRTLHHFPFPFRRIWEVEKMIYNFIAFWELLPKGRMIIFEQRPNYDFLVPLALKLVNGSRIVMDIDDWILDYRVFGTVQVKKLFDFFASYCDTCVVSSRDLEDRIGRHFRNIPVIPTYVDIEKFQPVDAPRTPGQPVLFSWVGTVFQDFTYDNVMFMVESFALACEELKKRGEYHREALKLSIVGGGDFYKRVQEQMATRFAEYNMEAPGWLAPDQMPAYLAAMDVGLYCLVEPSHFHKSKSPTKVFEYMACAKPTISTIVGEAPYFLEHGETGLLARDMQQFAQSMVELFLSGEKRKAMGAAGRRAVEQRFNLDRACAELKTVLLS